MFAHFGPPLCGVLTLIKRRRSSSGGGKFARGRASSGRGEKQRILPIARAYGGGPVVTRKTVSQNERRCSCITLPTFFARTSPTDDRVKSSDRSHFTESRHTHAHAHTINTNTRTLTHSRTRTHAQPHTHAHTKSLHVFSNVIASRVPLPPYWQVCPTSAIDVATVGLRPAWPQETLADGHCPQ